MALANKGRQTMVSLLVIVLLSLLAYFIAAGGGDFAGSLLVFLTFLSAAGVGTLLLLLRMFRRIKPENNLFYNYFGTLNLFLGLVQLCFLLRNGFPTGFSLTVGISLVIGIAIYYDIYKR